MVNDGNKGSLKDDCFVQPENSQHNLNLYQRGEGERIVMETEGRGFSDMYRNTSEELFLKSIMESSIGVPVPTMEMLGFKNLSQNFRADSEELFKSWLTNGENHGCNPSSIAHRTRQASRRLSTELVNQSGQQQTSIQQKKKSNDVLFTQSDATADNSSSDLNRQSVRNAVDKSMQDSNLYLAMAWFNSTQPMTRSRSSELRRRYAAMQSTQTTIGMEAAQNASGLNNLKQEYLNPNTFNDLPMKDTANQLGAFMSPSNSSSSTFNTPQVANVDKVSTVVNMLKGTLERKKLANQIEKETVEDSFNALYHTQGAIINSCFDHGNGSIIHEIQGTFKEDEALGVEVLHSAQGPFDLDVEGFVNPVNPVHFNALSREPSQSESSAAAPVVSCGFDACDGPSYSSQTLSICESSRKHVGNSSSENGSRARGNTEFREKIIGNLKDERKRGGLARYGSVTSAGSVDKGDPTKKRRVERSRKMAEAKERNLTPAIPSDMQSVLKRCENLEKEVRSLKLNLSFMNRKDSEQTKQIEDLQKKNEELVDEKERLVEEIERILSEIGKM